MPSDRPTSPKQNQSDYVEISLYEAHQKIYPRKITGVFTKWRWIMVCLTQLIFYGLPWLTWGNRPALLFDLEARRFYIFNLILYPQDLIYLVAILIISAVALFLFTAIAGRLWCGFTCPQTVYTKIFLWLEYKIEGDRSARIRLDNANLSIKKITKKILKHSSWISLSIWTGISFVGYFTPIRELLIEISQANLGPWQLFWVSFYSLATYGNAGFLREQVCKYMCPYARFQSAMFDKDTLIVSYDKARGEPRGARTSYSTDQSSKLGSCIDCTLCVQVCPTGIDIRDGLQYECIGCGACIDACNMVMQKISSPPNLIKLSTQNDLNKTTITKSFWQNILRPRILIYIGIFLGLCILLSVSLALRKPFKVNVVRDRGVMARLTPENKIENIYRLQIMNATASPQRYYINAHGITSLSLSTQSKKEEIIIPAAQSQWITVHLEAYPNLVKPGAYPIYFTINTDDVYMHVNEKSVFFVPHEF